MAFLTECSRLVTISPHVYSTSSDQSRPEAKFYNITNSVFFFYHSPVERGHYLFIYFIHLFIYL
uniref:Uncharacterized protein n=1 Tax=Octopus bimaculoides TaxID=37653 RepID=A0A0L8I8I1_OCTBM